MELLTITEAAYTLKLSPSRVAQFVDDGRLKSLRRRPYMFLASEVRRLAQQREKKRRKVVAAA